MTTYTQQLQALHAATIGGDSDTLLPLIKHNRADVFPPEKRIAIYRNGYRSRLTDAVVSDFPALSYYMGEKECRAAVRAFVNATPSASWDLTPYSYAFPAFFAAYTHDSAARDLAILEAAITEVFRMPESTPVTADDFAALGEEGLEDARFVLRRASKLLALTTEAHDFISAFRLKEEPTAPDIRPQYLCVVRHNNEVRRVVLDEPAYVILSAIENEKAFGAALQDAAERFGEQALTAALPNYIAEWLEQGMLQRM